MELLNFPVVQFKRKYIKRTADYELRNVSLFNV